MRNIFEETNETLDKVTKTNKAWNTRDSEVANGSHMIGSVKDLWRQTQEMG